MKYPSAMQEVRHTTEALPLTPAVGCYGVRDGVLLGLVLVVLFRTSEALAADGMSPERIAPDPEAGNLRQPMFPAPPSPAASGLFTAPAVVDEPVFSATEFRPHKHTVFDSDPTVMSFSDVPMLRGTTVWQRLSDYKSRDRVRVLTLLETRGSTVSLQAGKRGDPSLQWTSRLMSRGESKQGLLDRWFSISLAHAGNGFRNMSRPASLSPTAAATSAQVAGPAVASLK